MCFDILEKDEIITYRENDLEFLNSIRNGKYMQDDGTYCNEFFDIINEYDNKLKKLEQTSQLPNNPDYNKIEEFVISVNERVIKNEI
jgi:hypothetical protein